MDVVNKVHEENDFLCCCDSSRATESVHKGVATTGTVMANGYSLATVG